MKINGMVWLFLLLFVGQAFAGEISKSVDNDGTMHIEIRGNSTDRPGNDYKDLMEGDFKIKVDKFCSIAKANSDISKYKISKDDPLYNKIILPENDPLLNKIKNLIHQSENLESDIAANEGLEPISKNLLLIELLNCRKILLLAGYNYAKQKASEYNETARQAGELSKKIRQFLQDYKNGK